MELFPVKTAGSKNTTDIASIKNRKKSENILELRQYLVPSMQYTAVKTQNSCHNKINSALQSWFTIYQYYA